MQSEFRHLKQQLETVIIGQEDLLDRLMIGLLTGGHILLEGPPGLAKTTAVKALATAVQASFQRIQFTPDLMPGDVIGSEILETKTGQLTFVKGPIFHDIVLADEINRAPPKVQAALLEAMAEKQVTAGGATRALSDVFLVLATQNPLEQSGTYPLPEAQLDRFMLKVNLGYPSVSEELAILQLDRKKQFGQNTIQPTPSLSIDMVKQARLEIASQYVSEAVEHYIVALVSATRNLAQYQPNLEQVLSLKASPRATLSLLHAACAYAWLQEKDYVTPDHVLAVFQDVLRHRITISFAGKAEGWTVNKVLDFIQQKVPVPLSATSFEEE